LVEGINPVGEQGQREVFLVGIERKESREIVLPGDRSDGVRVV
jgi:hypothetical protein